MESETERAVIGMSVDYETAWYLYVHHTSLPFAVLLMILIGYLNTGSNHRSNHLEQKPETNNETDEHEHNFILHQDMPAR